MVEERYLVAENFIALCTKLLSSSVKNFKAFQFSFALHFDFCLASVGFFELFNSPGIKQSSLTNGLSN